MSNTEDEIERMKKKYNNLIAGNPDIDINEIGKLLNKFIDNFMSDFVSLSKNTFVHTNVTPSPAIFSSGSLSSEAWAHINQTVFGTPLQFNVGVYAQYKNEKVTVIYRSGNTKFPDKTLLEDISLTDLHNNAGNSASQALISFGSRLNEEIESLKDKH